jgi:tetratricopeptide (TPR) repeat protein
MRQRLHLTSLVLAALFVVAFAAAAAAQTGRVGGVVKDEAGNPIKGATVTAENPAASPSSFTATTDDKGRFSIIGLKSGSWSFSAQAPGFGPEAGKLNVSTIGAPNPPLTFTMKKGGAAGPSSALGSAAAKDLQADLAAADTLYNAQKYDEAIAAYRQIMTKAPALSVINLQIAAAYRNKKEYDNAITAYNDLLKTDPTNEKAIVGIGMTNLERAIRKPPRRP